MALAPGPVRGLLASNGATNPTWGERVITVKERRKHKRFKVVTEARYTKLEGHATINSVSVTRDISSGGLCTSLSRMIKKGDELLVELKSFCNQKKLATLAKVAWLTPDNKNGHNICGLEFLWVSSEPLLNEHIILTKERLSTA